MPGSAGMTTPGVLLTQSFKSMLCFEGALLMKGMLAVLADNGFFVFEHAGHFRLLYKMGIGFMVAEGV